MTVQEFVAQLDGVKRSGRGVIARCPAHDNPNPSLSVTDGERGVLVRCWAGCTTAEIIAAMGLKLCDLFYDAGLPRQTPPRLRTRPRLDRNQIAFQLRFHGDQLFLRARAVLEAASNLDIAPWTTDDLERAIKAVASACHDQERANIFDDVALELRRKVFTKEADRYAA